MHRRTDATRAARDRTSNARLERGRIDGEHAGRPERIVGGLAALARCLTCRWNAVLEQRAFGGADEWEPFARAELPEVVLGREARDACPGGAVIRQPASRPAGVFGGPGIPSAANIPSSDSPTTLEQLSSLRRLAASSIRG